ncbi:FmdB family zinc ribbon protein [Ottowia sp.]|uniref:FmdB family zinc ribbon protein n=1 Tax=Ottowia sp. TaxID=1898956 RepID=UPI002C44BD43|nr:FmdB family zinc ribbon protein [Ottowia sp.]HOB67826.1 zinc ribbon domain-containing protein [Ottowia sp.]HPZ55843.1 zinc ribbon domain-containing protein [Ottowia sp.]HQD48888.1 zinc ribbon domain-containing protein [Ottowia sp.]
MPIYAYKCASCGFAKDVLQKMSDPPLTVCPSCGEPAFNKQVTAAGFQLKGSGWYVTDFREGGKSIAAASGAKPVDGAARSDGAAPSPAPAASPAPASTSAPPASSPAPSGGGSTSSGD